MIHDLRINGDPEGGGVLLLNADAEVPGGVHLAIAPAIGEDIVAGITVPVRTLRLLVQALDEEAGAS